MTKAKKAISLIVSVVMLLGVLAVGVFANDNTGVAENGTIALSFDKASYSAGDTVRVTVKLTTDYYAATVSVPVQYDSSAVKFVSGTTASTLFGAGDATKTVVNDAAAGGKTYVYVGVLPQAAGGAFAQKANGVVLSTLTFTASKAISDTAAAFGVLNDQKSMTNLGGKLYVGSYKTSDVTSTVYTTGQKLTFPVMKAAAVAKYKTQVKFTGDKTTAPDDLFQFRLTSVITAADFAAMNSNGNTIKSVGFIAANTGAADADAAKTAVEKGTALPSAWKAASTDYVSQASASSDAYFGAIIKNISHASQATDIDCIAYVCYNDGTADHYVWYSAAVTAKVASGYDAAVANWKAQ